MREEGLMVTGLAADAAAAEAARNRLRKELPNDFKLTEKIAVREPRATTGEGAQRVEPAASATPVGAPAAAPDQTASKGEGAQTPHVPHANSGANSGASEPQPSQTASAGTSAPATEPVAQAAAPASQEPIAPQALAQPGPPDLAVRGASREVADCARDLAEAVKEGRILFQRGSAALDDASLAVLSHLPTIMKACPRAHIRIEGHTDIEGTPEANQALSIRRAHAVLTYLVRAGVDASQLEPVGFGEKRPLVANDTSQNKARNRRIEFVVRSE
jgi:outer membrane protein OmpA-like peptidoglycan-associated protein